MNRLHADLAEKLAAAVQQGEEPVVADGAVVGKKYNAALFNVARQFLKDNGIQADLTKTPAGRSLVDGLPFAGTEDDDAHAAV